MSPIDAVLSGLIDYAGLYPPASLDMQSAVSNYLKYRRSKHAAFLGRFIVDLNRLSDLRAAAGDYLAELRLSIIGSGVTPWEQLASLVSDGYRIEMIEIKAAGLSEIQEIGSRIPKAIPTYFEVQFDALNAEVLNAIGLIQAALKIRMGGVACEAFPTSKSVASALLLLAAHHVPFKATAGLHHPIRARHALTHGADSPSGLMHGFMNLLCAATLIHFGGGSSEATQLLEEQDSSAFKLTAHSLEWRSHCWSAEQLHTVREHFFKSFGSCSYEEPMHDLEALGWL